MLEQLFTAAFWKAQWAVVASAPWLIVPLLLVAGFIGWRWKASNDDGEIRGCRAERDAARGQLQLAHDKHGVLDEEIARLKAQVSEQNKMISELRTEEPARYQFETLSSNSALIANTLSNLTTSSAALGTTLTISGGRFKVVVEGLSDATKGSE